MAELGARCSNCFPPSLHPSSSIEDFISFLLHPYLAVNKSAGNPLRPFFKSVGSAFWELRPAGQGVSGERMPGQTGTQRPDTAPKCPDGISDTQQCPFFSHPPVSVHRQSFWREVAAERLGQCRRHRASVSRQQWASPRYCAPATAPAPPAQCPAQPFESRAHYGGGSHTGEKHIVKLARIPGCAPYQVAHTKLCTAHTASCDRLLTGERQYG